MMPRRDGTGPGGIGRRIKSGYRCRQQKGCFGPEQKLRQIPGESLPELSAAKFIVKTIGFVAAVIPVLSTLIQKRPKLEAKTKQNITVLKTGELIDYPANNNRDNKALVNQIKQPSKHTNIPGNEHG